MVVPSGEAVGKVIRLKFQARVIVISEFRLLQGSVLAQDDVSASTTEPRLGKRYSIHCVHFSMFNRAPACAWLKRDVGYCGSVQQILHVQRAA
jgi:hypothetical protein